jgi:AbrB family looped-hinge helix DNA binding protein
MKTTAKLQRSGRVTIPVAIRRQANLKPGDLVTIVFQRGKIVITPIHK